MVSTMFRTLQERNPGIPGYSGAFYDDGEEKDGLGGGAMVPSARGRSGVWSGGEDGFVTESKIESAAAACILWSTVGVGCLVGGRPKSSVSQPRYQCSGSGSDVRVWSGRGSDSWSRGYAIVPLQTVREFYVAFVPHGGLLIFFRPAPNEQVPVWRSYPFFRPRLESDGSSASTGPQRSHLRGEG